MKITSGTISIGMLVCFITTWMTVPAISDIPYTFELIFQMFLIVSIPAILGYLIGSEE